MLNSHVGTDKFDSLAMRFAETSGRPQTDQRTDAEGLYEQAEEHCSRDRSIIGPYHPEVPCPLD